MFAGPVVQIPPIPGLGRPGRRWTQCRAEFPAEPAHATGRRR